MQAGEISRDFDAEVFYWRGSNREVDLVLRRGHRLAAIEVTSGRRKSSFSGLGTFPTEFRPTRKLLVGGQGAPRGEFLAEPAANWLR